MSSTETEKHVIVKISSSKEQQNLINTRKGLKVLQQTTSDKENVIGRTNKENNSVKQEMKQKKIVHKSTQCGELVVTEADLTSDEPSVDYWKILADKRKAALDESFQENERLKDEIVNLKQENSTCKDMLDDSRNLVEILSENLKNKRKGFKVLQQTTRGKENLIGRVNREKDSEKPEMKRKKVVHKSTQCGESVVTEADLTSDEPSTDYWKILAEKRQAALDESFQENERLKDEIDNLKQENSTCKELLEDSRNLVEILTDMLQDNESSTEAAEEATED